MRGLRASPVLGRMKAEAGSDQSSLKLVDWAEIQIWRTGVLGVKTNFAAPSSKRTLRTPLLSSASKPPSSSASMRDCLRDSRARSDSRRKVASSIMRFSLRGGGEWAGAVRASREDGEHTAHLKAMVNR